MKKDCAYTRKSLRKYLRGHLFKYEQVRIARHLNACPVCRSEFQALKKVADTKQLLKDITPPETLGQRLKLGVSVLSRLKLLLYRPLWVIVIIGAGGLIYVNIIAPGRHDIEIENIEKSLPPAGPVASSPTVSAVLASAPVPTSTPQQHVGEPVRPAAPSPSVDPLLITITPAGEDAIRRINEVMRGHGELRKMRFSETVREISGSLTQKELLTFFARIEGAGKVNYSRKRFESLPSAEPVPFVIRMKPAPKTAEASPQAQEHKPARETAASLPVSAPTVSAP